MPTRAAVAVLALFALGCPPQKKPDRGIELQFKKPDTISIRPVVEKRLAARGLKARIDEDGDVLRLRIPEGTDPGPVKKLMLVRAKFELCEELPEDARRQCETEPPAGVTRTQETAPAEGCFFEGKDDVTVRVAAKKGITGRVLLEKEPDGRFRSFAVPTTCLSPTIAEATVQEVEFLDRPVLRLKFDRHGGKAFEALTTRLVGKRLLIVLDGRVQLAPVVMQPIAGGAAQLTTGEGDGTDLDTLAAALAGGALPELTLEVERGYGPPSLTR